MLGRIRREAENITINRTGILGVQSISTQYESVARPLDSLGITEIQYAPQGAQTASLQLNTLLTHTLEEGYGGQMSLDVMQNLTGNIPFSGIIDYGAEKIYFSEGYLETYSVSCGIGEVPQTSTNSIIFGDFGTGYEERIPDGIFNTLISLSVSFDLRNETETTAILHFLRTRKGSESFIVQNLPQPYADIPEGGYRKKFICDNFSSTFSFHNNYSIKATFIQKNN